MKTPPLKFILVSLLILISSLTSYSINYTSAGVGPSDWNSPASWLPFTGVVPTANDNVTISSGHQININIGSEKCRNLTVQGTINWTANVTLTVTGDYILSGLESAPGFGKISFNSPGTLISVTGTSSVKLYYNIVSNRTITAGSIINKTNAYVQIQTNRTLTNLGTLNLGTFTSAIGSVFTNGTNAVLSIKYSGFMATNGTFFANASGNTVNLTYATGEVPSPISGYYNLNLNSTSAGTKTLESNTIVANNLTMSANNHLNSNNFDLSVGGNWTNSGTFTASAGKTVTFNGTTAQTVSNTVGTTTFKGLTINNTAGVTLTSGTYILDEVLTCSNGTFNTGGRPFTMTSDASKTARIAPITGSGAIAGNFTVERFITGRDTTWADLSSPVQNSTFGDWANELTFVYYTYNPPSSYPTQWTYDEAADDFSPITSAATALSPGKGYEVFLTGGYDYSNFVAKPINTVGVPNQGNQNLNGLVTFNNAGSNLVGNPFASSISWSSVFAASAGLSNTYDMYDFASGNYATFGLGTEIGSGQGFWVYATGAPTLQIPESAKTASSNSSIRSNVESFFTLKLSSNDLNNNYYHTLKIAADNNSSDGWDNNDHPFRKSPNHFAPSINTIIDGKKTVINSFNLSNDSYSMPIQTRVGISGYYKIEAAGFENVSEFSCIKLEDKLLNKTVVLDPQNSYSFEMNIGDNPDRFIIHFSKNGDCKSTLDNNAIASEFDHNVLILPTQQGNSIEFNFKELTPVNITVTNLLGQTVVDAISMNAESQTANISIPSDFPGMYIIKIESAKGVIIKKYVRK